MSFCSILPCSCTFTVSPVPHNLPSHCCICEKIGIGRADPKELGLHVNFFATWFKLGKVFSAQHVDAAPRSCRTRWRHEELYGPRVHITLSGQLVIGYIGSSYPEPSYDKGQGGVQGKRHQALPLFHIYLKSLYLSRSIYDNGRSVFLLHRHYVIR